MDGNSGLRPLITCLSDPIKSANNFIAILFHDTRYFSYGAILLPHCPHQGLLTKCQSLRIVPKIEVPCHTPFPEERVPPFTFHKYYPRAPYSELSLWTYTS